jgi:hypothetical protein
VGAGCHRGHFGKRGRGALRLLGEPGGAPPGLVEIAARCSGPPGVFCGVLLGRVQPLAGLGELVAERGRVLGDPAGDRCLLELTVELRQAGLGAGDARGRAPAAIGSV